MPTPPLGDFTNQDPKRLGLQSARKKQKTTVETIDLINGKNQFFVKGHWLLASGLRPDFVVGDQVVVAWDGNIPKLILSHAWRRGKALGAALPIPLVEELFIATDSVTGMKDVFFRNHSQAVSLRLRSQLPGDPETVRWGVTRDAFYVRTAHHVYSIFQVTRNRKKPLGLGQRLRFSLLRVDQPLSFETTLLDATFTDSFTRTSDAIWGDPQVMPPGSDHVDYIFTRASLPATSGSAIHHRIWKLTTELIEEGLQDDVNFAEFLYAFIDDVILNKEYQLIMTVRLFVEFLTLELVGSDTGSRSSIAVSCGSGPNGNTGLIIVGPTTVAHQAAHSILDEEHGYIINGTTGVILYSTTGVVTTLARHTNFASVHGPYIDDEPHIFAANPPGGTLAEQCRILAQLGFTSDPPPAWGVIVPLTSSSIETDDKQDFFDVTRVPFIEESLYVTTSSVVNVPATTAANNWHTTTGFLQPYHAEAYSTTLTTVGPSVVGGLTYRIRRFKVLLLSTTLEESRFLVMVGRMTRGQGFFTTERFRVVVIDGTGALIRVLQDWRRLNYRNPVVFAEGTFEWLGSTRRHVIWYQKTGDTDSTNVAREEIVVMDWTTGEATVAGSDVVDFRLHNLQALAPDFLYEGKEARTAKRFIIGWDPTTGIPSLLMTDLREDRPLSKFKKLFDLRSGLVPDPAVIDPGPLDAFPSRIEKESWQMINDPTALGRRSIPEPELRVT